MAGRGTVMSGTLVAGQTWVIDDSRLNEIRLYLGKREAEFPVNSSELGEWFTFGSTLKTGGHWLETDGGADGSFLGLSTTHHWQLDGGRHSVKAGVSYQHLKDRYEEDRFQSGLMLYAGDDRTAPYVYFHGVGSGIARLTTDTYGLFVQDEWRVRDNLTLSAGLRYDLDTDGNNPDLRHPLTPEGRDVDDNNLQPRLGFSWDTGSNGKTVVRGGIGLFVGRYSHYSTFTALMFNSVSGRTLYQRVNYPPAGLFLDPTDPRTSGYGLPPNTALLAEDYPAPEATQARLGLSRQLGSSGLYLDVEGVYSGGKNEPFNRNTNWAGNDAPGWLSEDYNDVDTFTKEGRSRYSALSVGLNGTLQGGHLITAGLTVADKKNHVDDTATTGEPSDPADVEGEWGRSGTDERYRLVLSGVFNLPWDMRLATIYEYGSGRPWDRLYGYDFNGDYSANSDRPEEDTRNDQDGPRFSQLDVMLRRDFKFGARGSWELSLEVFNLLNTVNYDVRSVDNAMYFAGPTLVDQLHGQDVPFVPNPGFGTYRDTHRPREVQLGLRWRS